MLKSFFVSIILVLVICSCQSEKPEKRKPIPKLEYDTFTQELEKISISSQEFILKIKLSELPYQNNLVNKPNKYLNYTKDINASAANIGIYLTDAQYLRIYNKISESYLSSQSAQHLFQLIETKTLDTSMVQMQEGYRRKDSAIFYLNNALQDSITGLSDNERKQYLISLAYGVFIERNLIILSLLNKQSNYTDTQVAMLFVFLKKHNDQLTHILQMRNEVSSHGYHNYLRTDLNEYNKYYTKNIKLFEQGSNVYKQKRFVRSLLQQVTQMRRFITNNTLLIKED